MEEESDSLLQLRFDFNDILRRMDELSYLLTDRILEEFSTSLQRRILLVKLDSRKMNYQTELIEANKAYSQFEFGKAISILEKAITHYESLPPNQMFSEEEKKHISQCYRILPIIMTQFSVKLDDGKQIPTEAQNKILCNRNLLAMEGFEKCLRLLKEEKLIGLDPEELLECLLSCQAKIGWYNKSKELSEATKG